MNKAKLHEIAKFAAGLVTGDFITTWWMAANNLKPATLAGVSWSQDMLLPGLIFDAALILFLIHYGWHIGKTPNMKERTYLLVVGFVFTVVALVHVARIFFGMEITIAGWDLPQWVSYIGILATLYLSYMSFHLAGAIRHR